MQLDALRIKNLSLACPRCKQVSLKTFLQIEMEDRLPCDAPGCGISIEVASQYTTAILQDYLKQLGRVGFLRKGNKGD